MAVAGKSEVQAQGGEVVEFPSRSSAAREPQPQLVPIERHRLDLLENLRQIHG